MAAGVELSLYGIYFYTDEREYGKWMTYLSHANNSPMHNFAIEVTLLRTNFDSKMELPNREARLIYNALSKAAQRPELDFYAGRDWVVKYHAPAPLAQKVELQVNAIPCMECETDGDILTLLKGMGYESIETIRKQGHAFRSPENVETFVYDLQVVLANVIHIES